MGCVNHLPRQLHVHHLYDLLGVLVGIFLLSSLAFRMKTYLIFFQIGLDG
ncbi:hypothetical protein PMIT1327_00628 [Prochlorococcus marinus str. MIT 1327]|nr:hypothetical protein PMIT1312_00968 [Prochlorococcus marinus str. MIT 1312]KZR82972.1 hypothetical protein PMIT1327_00628 [Prochlorococcus marinus str. MIT 1327]